MKNQLAEARKEKGLSQLDVALLTRIPQSVLSHLENGRIFPYPGWRRRLAVALQTTEAQLFPEEGGNDGNRNT